MYTLEIEANDADYERVVSTGNDTTDRTFELPTPTTDRDALTLSGGQPVNHLLRVGPTQNGSGLFVVETVSVENGADRPFAGNVSFAVPSDAEVVTAMVNNERTAVSRTNDTAAVETMISPQEPTTVDVFYRLEDQTFETGRVRCRATRDPVCRTRLEPGRGLRQPRRSRRTDADGDEYGAARG